MPILDHPALVEQQAKMKRLRGRVAAELLNLKQIRGPAILDTLRARLAAKGKHNLQTARDSFLATMTEAANSPAPESAPTIKWLAYHDHIMDLEQILEAIEDILESE